MAQISKKVLNQHLRRMEKDGLLVRTDLSAHVPHIEYALTNPLGSASEFEGRNIQEADWRDVGF